MMETEGEGEETCELPGRGGVRWNQYIIQISEKFDLFLNYSEIK